MATEIANAPHIIEFRQLDPDEIVTPGCTQQIGNDLVSVFTYDVPASAYQNPIYKRKEPAA